MAKKCRKTRNKSTRSGDVYTLRTKADWILAFPYLFPGVTKWTLKNLRKS